MSNRSASSKVALAVFCHPDDIELLCAGTLVRLIRSGWTVYCSTVSGGDLGAVSGTCEEILNIRLKEAARGAETLGAKGYYWAGLHDLQICYNPENLWKVIDVFRKTSPDLVITHSPDCYMLDHEETSRLARMACFGMGIPLLASKEPPVNKPVPHLYYADALECKDKFGKPVIGDFAIEMEEVFPVRQEALKCHDSQRSWLKAHHGVDQYLITNEELARNVGKQFGAGMAEGFRQHLGHGYPQDNLLAEALAPYVRQPV